MSRPKFELVSLCPAGPGWRAIYLNRDERGKDGSPLVFLFPVWLWAAAKVTPADADEEPYQRIVGCVFSSHDGLYICEEDANFVGYLAPDEPTPATLEEWNPYERPKSTP